ncbi:hypothetical protein [Fimbriimonas ginsengisoli]|uniref:Uncharacterized protein n=1 Tax=Fimbriimonas ginsengisoli Gsoil 348 TaxID=661478 RepID=A0A068NTS3_FIMGI|nr:hypothetical protein [Fimbriimonas ginsengisoli]AIE86841.1 hypothetical protein OP10G_3473 [Fimbriimonas ginsengisoli Gsoil 348]
MEAAALHLPPVSDKQLLDLFARAEEIGLLLELTDGGITWEPWPDESTRM